MMNALREKSFTVKTLSEKLDVSRQAVRLWINRKELTPAYKVGRQWIVPESSANKFLEERSN